MPTIMSFKLGQEETQELEFGIEQAGFRKCLQIPYIFSFPYFSGSTPKLKLKINNCSKTKARNVNCVGRLYLLLPRITMQESGEVQVNNGVANDTVAIKPSQKATANLRFGNLPQPGNYIVRLECQENGKNISGSRDIMYFDALPKDGSTFSVALITISALVGFIAGLISGWLLNG